MVEFLATTTGRITRLILGVVLFLGGLFLVQGSIAFVVMALGFWAIIESVLDFWLFAPLFGEPFSGTEVHAH